MAGKAPETKTGEAHCIPIIARLHSILDTGRFEPAGHPEPLDVHVFAAAVMDLPRKSLVSPRLTF